MVVGSTFFGSRGCGRVGGVDGAVVVIVSFVLSLLIVVGGVGVYTVVGG